MTASQQVDAREVEALLLEGHERRLLGKTGDDDVR
jgi:hypothetical protein